MEESCVSDDFLGDIGQGLLHIANEVISVDCEVVALVSAESFLKRSKKKSGFIIASETVKESENKQVRSVRE